MSTESTECQALRSAIVENEREENAIRARMDQLDTRKRAWRATGRDLEKEGDDLCAELSKISAEYRDLCHELNQTE